MTDLIPGKLYRTKLEMTIFALVDGVKGKAMASNIVVTEGKIIMYVETEDDVSDDTSCGHILSRPVFLIDSKPHFLIADTRHVERAGE